MMWTLIVLALGLAGAAWVWQQRPEQRRTALAVVAIGGLGFQAVHGLEHVVQAGAWVLAPDQPPFLTPWAAAGADVLAVGGNAGLGNELLHLVGNVIFLVGLAGLAGLAAGTAAARTRSLRWALVIQGAHVAEHVALTVSAALLGRAIGVTTLFGTLAPGPAQWSLRVAAHLGINAAATIAAALAVIQVVRRQRSVGASYAGGV